MQGQAIDAAMDSVLPRAGRPAAIRIGGRRPGPLSLVSGHERSVTEIYRRLMRIESLRLMRGELVLSYVDRDPDPLAEGETADDVLFLPCVDLDRLDEARAAEARNEMYWTVLGKCAALGMISGRGVPT